MKTKRHNPVTRIGGLTRNNPIRGRWFALTLGGLLLTSICALLPSPAQAQCQRWDVSGQWVIRQSGGGQLPVNLTQGEWQQQSANLTGTGRVTATKDLPDFVADITGNITGNAFTMKVMVGKVVLRYLGTIGPDGKIQGEGHIDSERGKTKPVHWYGSRKMKCADEAGKSSSSDSEDQTKKHKKKGKHKGHHHDDDNQNQSND